MKALRQASERFALLSQRERGLIALTALVGLMLLIWTLALEPMLKANGGKAKQLGTVMSQSRDMSQQIDALRTQLTVNPNDALEAELSTLTRKLEQHQNDLNEELVDLVMPEQMAAVLAQLLARTEGVTLIEMRIQPPVALVEEGGLYRHGVRLELEGSYFKLKDALERMEQLEQRFYWRFLDYQVTQYPKARLQLQLDTLGTEEEPIRVGTHTGTVTAGPSR
ncbi:type II secretion system protein M [Marinobacter hydrocarbonoclasticus]|nr:type II secretion system protein M [Marinobacter nauticus]